MKTEDGRVALADVIARWDWARLADWAIPGRSAAMRAQCARNGFCRVSCKQWDVTLAQSASERARLPSRLLRASVNSQSEPTTREKPFGASGIEPKSDGPTKRGSRCDTGPCAMDRHHHKTIRRVHSQPGDVPRKRHWLAAERSGHGRKGRKTTAGQCHPDASCAERKTTIFRTVGGTGRPPSSSALFHPTDIRRSASAHRRDQTQLGEVRGKEHWPAGDRPRNVREDGF